MQSFFATRMTRWLGGIAAVTAIALVVTTGAWAAGVTYYSQGSVAPEVPGNWNTVRAGGGTPATVFTGGDIFVIQVGHNMGTGAAWTVSGTGAKIQIESGGTLTANNIVAVPAFQVDNGGTYIHNAVSGGLNGVATDVPGSTSRAFGATSTVEFQKWANGGTSPVALPNVTWGNLKINVATLAGSWQMSGALTTIAGNLIIQSTGGTTREFRLNANSPATSTLNLTGDLQVSGGIFNITSGSAVETFNIGGNLTLTGGTLAATGAGPHTVAFTGGAPSVTFSRSGGAALDSTRINWVVASGKTLALNNGFTVATGRTFTVNGMLQRNTGGTITLAGTGVVTYAGSGALAYNHTGTVSVGSEWTGTGAVGTGVPANVTMQGAGELDMPSGTRGTPGSFTQTAGTVDLVAVTLELGGSLAVTPGFNSNVSTVRFISGSAATLSCTSGGVTFSALTVNKSGASLGLSCDASVTGALTLTAGTVSTGANTLSNVSVVPVTRTSGYVIGNFLKAVTSGASTQTWEIGDATRYTPVTITGTGGGFASGFNGLATTTSTDRSGLAASGIDPNRSVNRYHTITATGYTGGTYDITLTFDPTDVDPAAAAHTASFIVRKNTGGIWTATTNGVRTATTTQATGLTGFSDFSIGEQGIDHYVVTVTSPQDQGATFSTSVSAEDALNIPVSTDNTTAVTMSSNGAAQYDSNGDATFGDNVKTLTGGAFTINTRDNTAETVTLTATDGNGKTGSRTGLVIQTPLSITTTTLPNATAGVAYSQTVAATGGTPPYSFSILTGSLPSGLAITPGTGEISGTSNVAGTSNFTVQVADAASGTATQVLSITVVHAAPTTLTFDVQPSSAAAGVAIAPAVKVKVTDAFSNPVPTELVSLTLVGTGTLSGNAPTATDGSGIATFSTLSVDLAGSKQLSASTGSLGPVLSSSFTISAGAAATVAFDVEPSNATAGVAITPAVKVKVTDAFTNPVASELVSLSLVGTGALSGNAPTATDGSGIATFSTLSVDLAGSKQLSASTSGAGPTLSTNFTISAGAAATVAFDVEPSNAAAGVAIAPAVKVKVTDAFTNPVPSELVSLTLVGAGTLSGNTPTATDGSGIATFSTLSINLAGSKQLSASTAGAGPTLSTNFTISAGAAATVAFDVEPSNAAAGVAIAPAVKVKVTDAFTNPVATELVSLSLVGTGTLSGYAPTATDGSGIATFSTLSINLAGSKQLSASTSGAGPTLSASFTISAGAAATVAFDVEPSNAAAGATITPAVKVKVTDAFTNPVATELVSLSLVGTGTLSGNTPTATDGSGIATFSGLSVNLAGTKQLSASTTGAGPTLSANFTITAGGAATIAFDVEPSNAAAGATITPAVKVKVTDAFANPVPTELVSLSLVGTGALSGNTPTATDGSGIATFSGLSVNLAGSKQLSASTSGAGPTLSANFTISAGAAATVAFDVEPSNAAAGATITPAVKVKVTDALTNPVASELVSLSLVGTGTLSGSSPTATDGSGIATFASLSVDLAGSKQLSASTTGAGPTLSASFTISAGTAATLAFDVQPTNTLVNATITPAVRLKVTDALANPVSGELVSLSLVGAGTLSGASPTATDGNGFATFSSLSLNQSGSRALSATTTGLGPVLSDPFNVTCPTLSVLPASLPNGTVGTGYSQTVAGSGGVSPYTFAVTAGSLPTGLTLTSGTGDITGTPTAAASYNFTVTATDAAGCTGSQAYTVEISVSCPAITVLPASLPSGSIGVAYNQTVTASAGTAPFSFSVTVGTLPAGLSLSSGGALTGTPTTAGVSNFTIGVTDASACTGSTAYALTILATPAAVTNLAAVQQRTGNDGDGTTKIAITFTMPPGASTAEVYRAGFGHYPLYDNAGGSVPATPSYPPASPWVLTAVTASGQNDEPTLRDSYHYVVFVKNAGGGVSAVSNKTAGALNYHLGDVSNGTTPGQGNNAVSLEDISLLGANYGITEPEITTRGVAYLDVGPTIDLAATSRPTVDSRVDFEDLIVDALNYQVVSAPPLVATAAKSSAAEEFRVVGPSLVEAGQTVTVELWLKGAGRVQGFSAKLAWDPTVVEPLGMESAQWVEGQGGLVLSPGPGTVDAALLGAREVGLSGEGEVARVRFRVLRTGESGIGLAKVEARDAANRRLGDGELVARAEAVAPERTVLLAARPNPVRGGETSVLEFALAARGRVELAIYGVDGRRVRTVVREEREAGVYREGWDGRDEGGHRVGAGVYYALMVAGPARFTQKMIVIQ